MQIREANTNDFTSIIDIWRDCNLLRPWNDPKHDLHSALACPCSTVFVGSQNDIIIATALAGFDGHRGWLYYLAVSPQAQGQSLGRQMLGHAAAWLKNQGAPKLNLMVRQDNQQVIAFYKNQGFTQSEVVCLQKVLN